MPIHRHILTQLIPYTYTYTYVHNIHALTHTLIQIPKYIQIYVYTHIFYLSYYIPHTDGLVSFIHVLLIQVSPHIPPMSYTTLRLACRVCMCIVLSVMVGACATPARRLAQLLVKMTTGMSNSFEATPLYLFQILPPYYSYTSYTIHHTPYTVHHIPYTMHLMPGRSFEKASPSWLMVFWVNFGLPLPLALIHTSLAEKAMMMMSGACTSSSADGVGVCTTYISDPAYTLSIIRHILLVVYIAIQCMTYKKYIQSFLDYSIETLTLAMVSKDVVMVKKYKTVIQVSNHYRSGV
ncbi:hypothetical protein EON63_07610 [archaeon]|nr:MAG: hypothetical protein EON63_07610 [archaeon]